MEHSRNARRSSSLPPFLLINDQDSRGLKNMLCRVQMERSVDEADAKGLKTGEAKNAVVDISKADNLSKTA